MYWNTGSVQAYNHNAWLTLTWDVLKYQVLCHLAWLILININMRCIEMTIYDPYDLECSLININMRCIEMTMWTVVRIVYLRLTLTWDVLKCLLDMLVTSSWLAININMRCIEIWKQKRRYSNHHRLTLTWDVLKFRWSHRQSTWNEININMRCIEIKRTYLSYILLLD